MSDDSPAVPVAIERRLSRGAVVRGQRWGQSGDQVLLLHEPGRDLDAWGSLPWQLARALPLEITAIDLPGHGLSDGPWEPGRLGEVVRVIATSPHPNRHPEGEGRWGEGCQWETGGDENSPPLDEGSNRPATSPPHTPRQFIIAAGSSALTSLALAAELKLSGLVCLSPDAPADDHPLDRSPRVPKFFVAGSSAGSDLAVAQHLAKASGGWAAVASLPVPARGTALLQTPWSDQLTGDVIVFLRDCLSWPAGLSVTGRRFPQTR